MKTYYYISKLNLKESDEIQNDLSKQYKVDNFFDTEGKFVFGNLKNVECESNVFQGRNSPNERTRLPTIRDQNQANSRYEILNREKIKKYFAELKPMKNYNHFNNESFDQIPKNISLSLKSQKKILLEKNKKEEESNKVCDHLIFKSGKKRNDLLINTLSNYQIKNEYFKTLEERMFNKDNKSPFELLGGMKTSENIDWVVSLRRPFHFKGERKCLINAGSDNHPFWTVVKERAKSKKEYLVASDKDAKSRFLKFRKNNKLFLSIDAGPDKRPIENIAGMCLEGKNLYNEELRNALKIRRARINKEYIKKAKKLENIPEEMVSSNYTNEMLITDSSVTHTYLNNLSNNFMKQTV